MGVWDRSWMLMSASFGVIRKDKEMLWFPVLSGLFSLLFTAALIVPTFIATLSSATLEELPAFSPLQIAVLFFNYFGLSFIATFFNVCVVYTTRVRLSGGDATFLDSVKFALSRVHLIAAWSVVSASVGLLLHALDSLAERLGLLGKILISLLRWVIASAWAITTIFVVPAMVYRDLGPIDAIRDSIATLERHWGESLVRHFGLGIAAFVCMIPPVLLVVAGVASVGSAPAAAVALIAIGVVVGIGVITVFNVANTVFNTALYHWAVKGVAAEGFHPDWLSGALRPKS